MCKKHLFSFCFQNKTPNEVLTKTNKCTGRMLLFRFNIRGVLNGFRELTSVIAENISRLKRLDKACSKKFCLIAVI